MEKDFDYINDEKEQKIIEMLTPKHLEYTMKLKKIPRKNRTVGWLKQLSAIAAMIAIVFFIGAHLLQPGSAYSMPATSKEILSNTIKAIRELSSISMEFDARIQTVTPDHADCSTTGTPAKCRYRYIQGVKFTKHRNLYLCFGRIAPEICKACRLCTHNNCSRLYHICIIVPLRILQLGSKYGNIVFLQPLKCLLIGAGNYLIGKKTSQT